MVLAAVAIAIIAKFWAKASAKRDVKGRTEEGGSELDVSTILRIHTGADTGLLGGGGGGGRGGVEVMTIVGISCCCYCYYCKILGKS